ncbi:MAG: C40 family peptidase [Gammaproteobacteria bacterium]|nr:C40 family peptidase [Gammaproteobacteria bacterium]
MLLKLRREVFHMLSSPAKYRAQSVSVLLAAAIVAGCASTDAQPRRPQATSTHVVSGQVAHEAANVALDQVGRPYAYGGAGPSGFDCSGLVQFAYAHAGKRLPRTTGGLWDSLRPVQRSELRRGDILFFRIKGKMSHVGLYLGRGRFVHAPSSGKTVSVAGLDTRFYRKALIRGGRP